MTSMPEGPELVYTSSHVAKKVGYQDLGGFQSVLAARVAILELLVYA
jgi:hypothetical protein